MSTQVIASLVNAYAGAFVSVSQMMGVEATFLKGEITPGVNAPGSRVAALIGVVGPSVHGTVALMADMAGFSAYVKAMTGGMIEANPEDPMSMSVIGELTNMTSGQALMKVEVPGLDITPPQLMAGENLKAIPTKKADVKSFTLPFDVGPEKGRVYLVLSFHE
ncbi:chemotaxis protein CheX [Thermanaerovibrio acidaminovorans]|jgi:chemotaxis protein CheX|uniref:Chemotaxis phosphatase CheX-like domain-containing protein n=1 Tax=Thermanaerovibrio acidaminovorans (strain ATCC 49978 / DSM 6589 / Su883) TaxID=525903 RepID=D1B8E2_THEAS|nr:chemotaxis protein CheX [Thermanaerovibrio acidaminovorans]ACZ18545.1 hypothetical protein Taci_0308 [Thermanaerovibrio acidaminovorans DSM 6589]